MLDLFPQLVGFYDSKELASNSTMAQCLFDQPLWKTLKQFSRIWFFLRSALPWIIWCQHNDLVFNELQWLIEKTRPVI